MNTGKNISARLGACMLVLLAMPVQGCLGGSKSDDSVAPPVERPLPVSDQSSVLRLNVETSDPSLMNLAVGPIRAQLRSVLSGRVFDIPLWNVIEEWPQELVLDAPVEDDLEVTVYVDLDGDERFDACPFPRGVNPTPDLSTIDTIRGTSRTGLNADDPVRIELHRVFCGPGNLDTGLSGTVVPPAGGGSLMTGDLFLYLENLEQSQEILQIELEQPKSIGGETESFGLSTDFSVGELLPGSYTITAFTDDDEDGHPTPCGEGLGGGDRVVSAPRQVVVTTGNRLVLDEPLELALRNCPETLTGINGQLVLDVEAEERFLQGTAGPLSALEGGAYLTLSLPNSSEAVVSHQIFSSVSARPFPQDFTVTGLPEGLWRVVYFVDRDGNGRFAPCDGLPAGFDRLYAIQEDVRISASSVIDVGSVELSEGNCGDAPPTGLRGMVSAEREAGAVGSGRTIRMELYPTFDGGERLSFLLFENHWSEEGIASVFSQEVPPGSYQARIYLDTDRNGDHSSCDEDPYGDRASSNLFSVVLESGQLLDLGHFELVVESCAVPQSRIELSLNMPEDEEVDLTRMRMHLEEAGGWAEDRELRGREVLGLWVADPTLVAPGDYRLVIYEDRDASGTYDPCANDGADRVSVSADVSLDRETPRLITTLDMAVQCR